MSTSGNIDPKVIESLPEAFLKITPGAQPPPGVVPNFIHPPTRVPVMLGVTIPFLILALFCFSIRIYTRIVLTKNWRWDDLTCTLGFMCSIVFFGVVFNGCINGVVGRHEWDIHLDKVLGSADLIQSYVTTIMATPALGLIKSSLFIQYYILFSSLRWVRISVWIGGSISGVFYVCLTIAGFIFNSPWPGESLLGDILSWHYLNFANVSIPVGVIGMLVDWYLFILPIPAILPLQMSPAKKFGILIIFMTGGLAAIASVISLYYRILLQQDGSDTTWKVGYTLLWPEVEMFAGVAASSMPTVKLFFYRQNFSFPSFGSAWKSSFSQLIKSSKREQIPEDDPGLTWGIGKTRTHTTTAHGTYKMRDLESGGVAKKTNRGRDEGSQIFLTQNVSVTREMGSD